LWGGEIIDTKMRSGNHCARVRSHRLDANGKPVRGFANATDFLACGGNAFDPKQFRAGGLATFAGHVQAVESGRAGATMPVLLISDARVWKSMPRQGLPQPTPTSIPAAGH
jgi:starvation-inducible outer membrane lipoprotein